MLEIQSQNVINPVLQELLFKPDNVFLLLRIAQIIIISLNNFHYISFISFSHHQDVFQSNSH